MEVGGINYIIPVDAKIAQDRDVSFEALPLDQVLNATEGDTTFAVPAATDCGGLLSAVITPVVNAKIGLPSPSGKNSVVLNSATSDLATFGYPPAYAPHEGQQLAADWHSAVLP